MTKQASNRGKVDSCKAGVQGLDAIMEDLMVGHNFDYAREQLLKLKQQWQAEARINELNRALAKIRPHMTMYLLRRLNSLQKEAKK